VKPEQLGGVQQLVTAHPGRVPLFLCFMRPGGEVVFVETHERFGVMPSLDLQKAADDLFGEETYYAKVDTSVPERQRKPWEKRNGNGENGSGEE
jgi:hypothetical protein